MGHNRDASAAHERRERGAISGAATQGDEAGRAFSGNN